MLIDACWACVNGLHQECYAVHEMTKEVTPDFDAHWLACCCTSELAIVSEDEKRGPGRPMLDPDDVTDPKSTGRKRAAMVAPIFSGMECEWSRLRFAGGGPRPIVGCVDTLIEDKKGKGDRHHGPDKNVLNNSVGINLHRICPNCHHRWHALNDPYYDPKRPAAGEQYLPLDEHPAFRHDPFTYATEEEVEQSEAYWDKRTEKRGDYPFASPE